VPFSGPDSRGMLRRSARQPSLRPELVDGADDFVSQGSANTPAPGRLLHGLETCPSRKVGKLDDEVPGAGPEYLTAKLCQSFELVLDRNERGAGERASAAGEPSDAIWQ
jgi:hypothetical protein